VLRGYIPYAPIVYAHILPGFRVSTLTVNIIPVLMLTYVVRTVRASGRHHSRATNLSAMGDNNRMPA